MQRTAILTNCRKKKCNAFRFSRKYFISLQRNSFFSTYDRTYRVYVSSGKMERQENNKSGDWYPSLRQVISLEDVS